MAIYSGKQAGIRIKIRLLGYPHPGQDLCSCRISVTPDDVTVTVRRDGAIIRDVTYKGGFDLPCKVTLRRFAGRIMTDGSRWNFTSPRPGYAVFEIYYPSRRWSSMPAPAWLSWGLGAF